MRSILHFHLRPVSLLLLALMATACNPTGTTTIGPNFYPGITLSPANSTVVVSNAQVFSQSVVDITVYLKDANNAPFVSSLTTVSLQISGGTSSGTFSPITNNGDGSYSATFSGAAAGTPTTIQAVVNGTVLTSPPPVITVTSGNFSLSNSLITVSSSSVASGSSVNVTLTVKDSSGNPATSGGLNVAFSNSGGSSTGTFSSVTDQNNGTYTATFTGNVGGTPTSIGATIQGSAVTSSLPTVTVTGGVATSISVLSGSGQTATAGSVVSSPLIAVVKDSNSTPLSGVTVTWAVTGGGGSTSSCTTTTNGSGQAQCNFTTGTIAGTNTVTATATGVATPATFTAAGTVGAAASISVVSGSGQSATVGSAVSSSLVAVVRDSNSNPISGVAVTWAVTVGAGSTSSCTTTTNGSGQVQCSFTTGVTAGSNTITATATGVATPATFAETGTAGAAVSIAVSSGNNLSATAGSQIASPLVAIVTDSNSNAVSGVTVSWSVTGGGGLLSACTTSTNSSGLAQCTLTTGATAGTNTVHASVAGIANPATFTETGNAGAASSIAISNGNNQTGQISTSLAHVFQVTVEDSNGNLVSGATINWAITSGSGFLSSTSTTTSVSGISTSTLTLQSSVGTESVTATINGTSTLVTFTAYAIAYTNVRPITINYSQVGGTSETNFPMLFSGTYSYLSTTANGGYVTNSSGYDIIFTTDSLCTTKVPGWEIESYSPTTGAVNFWVDIPSLSATANTTIYLCYGNSSITTFQSTAASTWDSNYTGIWHMNNSAASTTVTDSTGANNGVNGANTSTKSVTGKIGNALSYNGSSDGTDLGSAVSYVTSGVPFTVELWAYMSTVSGYPTLLELDDSGGNNWELFASNQGGYSGMDIGSSSGWVTAYTNTTTPVGSWHFWVATYNGGTRSTRSNFAIYEDAVSQSLGAPSGFGGHANHTYFGKDDQNHFNGYLDEIKFSKTARSPGWITAEFNNQNSPATFYTVGSTL